MFTGLVEETGVVEGITKKKGSVILEISGKKVLPKLAIDHSIAVNGVCLTVIRRNVRSFFLQAVEETMKKTTLGSLTKGSRVNLERPMKPTDRLGGHFVLGHVDGTGTISAIETRDSSIMYWITVPKKFAHHLIQVGSIAVEGVSLTMAEVKGNVFAVSIIPHTLEVTTFKSFTVGMAVNLEFDVLGKFVENFLRARKK